MFKIAKLKAKKGRDLTTNLNMRKGELNGYKTEM